MGRVKLTVGRRTGGRPLGRLNKPRVAAALGVLAAAVVGIVFAVRWLFPPGPAEPVRAEPPAAALAAPPPPPPLVEERIRIPARSNLADILARRGFDNLEIHNLR
ncbi:MAG: hypothetical protein HGA94_01590, partial [Candidatus Aminicenantes bacterium]|nr:hypothetical protein [Candidatus Aminicenantes bacterium]